MRVEDVSTIRSKEDLITYIAKSGKTKFLFFWGHQKNSDGSFGKTCLSQWYEAGFVLNDIHYPTAEHYMMAEKARLFNDYDTLVEILNAKHPGDAKQLGRKVKGYQEDVWMKHRFDFVVRGNEAKFSQDKELKEFLINTGERVLVEASPRDRIWGIGMDKNDPDVEYPAKWKGLNLLGFALMATRNVLVGKYDD